LGRRGGGRLIAVPDRHGLGPLGVGPGQSPAMQMSASYYGTAELDQATHVHKLVKGDDIEVCLLLSSWH